MSVRRTSAVALFISLAVMPSALAGAGPGTLDTTFGGDGKVTTDFGPSFDGATAVAIQADGKIVAVGGAGGSAGRFALARYDTDGTLDATFGGDGKVRTDFTNRSDVAQGVAIQADGKIVAAGDITRFTPNGVVGRFALARYDTNGTLDPTFGGDGRVTTSFTDGEDGASAVAIQADGKIVAAGSANGSCFCSRFALARYDDDGTLDATFGGDGKVTTRFAHGSQATAVAIQADGKIVAVGGQVPEVSRFEVARYGTDGTLDPSFSGDGKLTTNMGLGEESATGVAIQANGRIVVAGYTDVPHEFGDTFGPGKFALARYRADGTLHDAFGGDGKVTTRFGRTTAAAEGMAIQADGKIVAVGHTGGDGGRFALVRYDLDGGLDATFGGDGRVTTNFTAGEDLAFGVAVQADGRIVAAGRAGGSGGRFALARYVGG
jgi:uncharacterized delta-60 repeat protein